MSWLSSNFSGVEYTNKHYRYGRKGFAQSGEVEWIWIVIENLITSFPGILRYRSIFIPDTPQFQAGSFHGLGHMHTFCLHILLQYQSSYEDDFEIHINMNK